MRPADYRPWSAIEDALIRELWERLDDAHLAARLCRSFDGVVSWRRALGLRRSRPGGRARAFVARSRV
jgi:hypothetical protein